MSALNISVEPDLHPLYPTPADISLLLSHSAGLSPPQKATLVAHSLYRACCFGDLGLLTYLLNDTSAAQYVDLDVTDEDGLGLISTTILGFGAESERDVEREECVRLLVAQGANVNAADNSGWTPLHHASLLSPPTLISFLLTHGNSSLTKTRRGLTPLDIITAYSPIPGREDVAFLIEEAMRTEGWQGGGRMQEERRRLEEKRELREQKVRIRKGVGEVLGLGERWWGEEDSDSSSDSTEDPDDEEDDFDSSSEGHADYTKMLVFTPAALPGIFSSLITDIRPTIRHSEPAKALYLLARFACLACDHNWLEDLVVGAVDKIEETVYAQPDDVPHLAFWLYNSTMFLHMLKSDKDIAETCDILGIFVLLEELLNAIYVFIIRIAERKIDPLLDAAMLDYSPLASEFESVQFESEWSILRSFATPKKKILHTSSASISASTSGASLRGFGSSSPSLPSTPRSFSRPSSPAPPAPTQLPVLPSVATRLRQTLTRSRAASSPHPPASSVFSDAPPPLTPKDITNSLTAMHTLLLLAGINPALIAQAYSQVIYWTACELFNRILTRKKHLCRSRAVQINMNLSALEEWIVTVGLPRGIASHFDPVRELLGWLQCLSSIDDFSDLIATIQTMRSLNPLQMRRAVRDYRYEVGEGRMSEECNQYLAQLQKDWEHRRVSLGVEAIRKEIGERERDREGSVSSHTNEGSSGTPSNESASSIDSAAQRAVDLLFSRDHEKSVWTVPKPPEVLGELLDSRHMLPLFLPSDPEMLCAVPPKQDFHVPSVKKRESVQLNGVLGEERSASRASHHSRGAMEWHANGRKARHVGMEMLEWVDNVKGIGRWTSLVEGNLGLAGHVEEEENEEEIVNETGVDTPSHLTPNPPRTNKNSPHHRRRSGRQSTSGDTAMPDDFE